MKKFLISLLAAVGAMAASSPDLGLRPSTSWAANNIMNQTSAAGVRTSLGIHDWLTNVTMNFGLTNVSLLRYLPSDPTTTDCSTALANCLADAPDGAVIELPPGTMVFDNPVSMPNKRFWFRGKGMDKTVLYNRQAWAAPIFYVNADSSGLS